VYALGLAAKGILEWGEKYKPEQGLISPDIGQFLDRFYLSRIGIRILIGQHIALANPRPDPNYVGIICTKTDICSIGACRSRQCLARFHG